MTLMLPAVTATVGQFVRPHRTKFWGQDCACEPALVDRIFGDGTHVIAVTPTDTRPNYYVVRVDSHWAISSWAWNEDDSVGEHLDEILDVIEDEFGDASYSRSEDADAELWDWPALNVGAGVSWCALIPRWGHRYD